MNLEILIHGLVLGSTIGVIAIGFALIFNVLRLINFAHGELLLTGAYLCYFLYSDLGIPFFISAFTAIILNGFFGMSIEKLAYRPLREQKRLLMFVSSIGVSICLQSFIILVFRTEPKSYKLNSITIASTKYFSGQLIIVVFVLILIPTTIWFLKKTKWGLAMKAIFSNPIQAKIIGLPIDRIISIAFFFSSSIAGLAGIAIGINKNLSPSMGFDYVLWAFAASIIAGFGNLIGVLITSIGIGIILNVLMFKLTFTQFTTPLLFILMLVILFVRPKGIFGKKIREV